MSTEPSVAVVPIPVRRDNSTESDGKEDIEGDLGESVSSQELIERKRDELCNVVAKAVSRVPVNVCVSRKPRNRLNRFC